MIPKLGKAKPLVNKQQKPMNLNIDLKDMEDIKCTSCGNEFFIDVSKLKYINPIQSPTGKDTVAAVVVGKVCNKCGELFNPDRWKRMRDVDMNSKFIDNKKADEKVDTPPEEPEV